MLYEISRASHYGSKERTTPPVKDAVREYHPHTLDGEPHLCWTIDLTWEEVEDLLKKGNDLIITKGSMHKDLERTIIIYDDYLE